MTDTRLRGEWLNNMRFDDLSDAAWRVFTNAMMWSNENGTDGVVPRRYLKMTHPDGEISEAFDEILEAGLWSESTDGYVFIDWDGVLGQETAERVELNREKWRQRQRDKRERDRKILAKSLGVDSTPRFPSVTRDITGGRTGGMSEGDVGTGTGTGAGTGRASYEGDEEASDSPSGKLADVWPDVAALPGSNSDSTSIHIPTEVA
jgi:hypothetical protein